MTKEKILKKISNMIHSTSEIRLRFSELQKMVDDNPDFSKDFKNNKLMKPFKELESDINLRLEGLRKDYALIAEARRVIYPRKKPLTLVDQKNLWDYIYYPFDSPHFFMGRMETEIEEINLFLENLMKFINESEPGTSGSKLPTLYYDRDGDLWREPKSEYYYSISEGRQNIFETLLANENKIIYMQTNEIGSLVGMEARLVRKTIGDINKMVKNKLDLSSELIQGLKYRGYRINPQYKIEIQNK